MNNNIKGCKYLFSILFICTTNLCTSQSWLWSNQFGCSGLDYSSKNSMCLDQTGNIYVSGYFFSTPFHFNSDSINNMAGTNDFYIAKYNSVGSLVWLRQFGGPNSINQNDYISSLHFNDATNSLYFSGGFYFNCSFDSVHLSGYGFSDAFVGKMDAAGNIIWAKNIGGSGDDGTYGMAIDLNGNIFLEVHSESGGVVDSIGLNPGVSIIKFDPDGIVLWNTHKFWPSGSSAGYEATFEKLSISNNNLFALGGAYSDTLHIDTITTILNFPTQQNILTCLDATTGIAIWARPCASDNPQAMNLAALSSSDIVITGSFETMGIFELDTLFSTVPELFVAKYDSLGSLMFAKDFSSTVFSQGSSISLLNDGGFYISGTFRGNIDFGNFSISANTSQDLYFARFDSLGNCIGARNLGQGDAHTIVADANNSIYLHGRFFNTITFGTNPSLTSYGQSDLFLASSQPITGIGNPERRIKNQLLIYANPNTGKCTINIPDEFLHERTLILRVFDSDGKLIQEKTLSMDSQKISLDLTSEAKGIYQASISNNTKTYYGTIVFD